MKYIEANVPDHLYTSVQYITRLRTHMQSDPLWLTVCQIRERESDKLVAVATARCSQKDQPNRKIGRAIAIGRALKTYDSIGAG